MKKLSAILFACIALAFMACEEEPVPDTKAPTVIISSPQEGAAYDQDQEITFTASATDDAALESVIVSITPPEGPAQVVHTESKENFTNGDREVAINRTFPISMAGELAAGDYILSVRASDVNGNTTDESVSIYINAADLEAPAIKLQSPEQEAVSTVGKEISVEASIADNAGLASISLHMTPPGGQAQLVHAEDFPENTAEASLSKTVSFDASGNHLLTIQAVDAFGNTAKENISISVREPDTDKPTITILNPGEGMAFNSDDVISLEAEVKDNREIDSVRITLRAPDGQSQVVYQKSFPDNTTEANVAHTLRFGTDAAIGTYIISFEATDASANTVAASRDIYIRLADKEAPAISIHKPAEGEVFRSDEEIPLEVVVTDDSGLESVSVSIIPPGGQAQLVHTESFGESITEATINQSISLGDQPASGNYTIRVEATDKEGHSRDKSVMVVVEEPDTIVPTVTISSPAEGTEYYSDQAINLQAAIADNAGLQEVTVWLIPPGEEVRLVHTESPDAFFNNDKEANVEEAILLDAETAPAGTYTISVRATDKAGNTTEEKVNISVLEADNQAPTITIISPEEESSFEQGAQVSLDATVEDDKKLAEIRVKITLGTSVTVYENTLTDFDSDTQHQLKDTTTIPADAELGTYYITITAIDAAGNVAEKTITIEVVAAT